MRNELLKTAQHMSGNDTVIQLLEVIFIFVVIGAAINLHMAITNHNLLKEMRRNGLQRKTDGRDAEVPESDPVRSDD